MLLAVLASACETPAPAVPDPTPSAGASPTSLSSPAELAVAFVEDLSPEDAFDRVQPVFQAVELAFATSSLVTDGAVEVEVVPFDTQGDLVAAAEIADEIVGDPRFIAAIAAPDLGGQAELAEALAAAKVPLLSLSARGEVARAAPGTWLRFVPPIEDQARALAAGVKSIRRAREGVCVVASAPDGTAYERTALRALPANLSVTEVRGAAGAADAGCGLVVWTGYAEAGAELALALAATGPRPPTIVGGPALRHRHFIDLAGRAAEGAVSLCPCADVSTSLDLAAQRFVQDYQSEFGSPPAPFAVEAWDAAHLLIEALREGGPTRSSVLAWLARVTSVRGLGGSYVFEGGELGDPASAIRRYRVEGRRWVLVELGRS